MLRRNSLLIAILMSLAIVTAAVAAGKMVRCAFDGMAMKDTVMKKATVKGETVYFCSDDQKTHYLKSPEKYRRTTKIGPYSATVNFLTNMEHMEAMKAMGMEMGMKPSGAHHLSVCLEDKSGKDVKPTKVLLRVTDPAGKGVTKPLKWNDMMTHYGTQFELKSKGKYQVAVMVLDSGKQYKSTVDYIVK
ncbi:MAG: hypothetical protein HYX78_15990 [Armatimonadetes bacterium]|nr:hypothetical protein [Armatimonadota bacterium]